MGLFDRFRKRETNADETALSDPLLTAIIGSSVIDRNQAMEIPVVQECVELICDTFAMIPFKLYEETITNDGKKTTKEVDDDRTDIINNDTRDTLDGHQFKKALAEDYLMGKGGYAYIKKNGNRFVGLYYVEDDAITIQKNTDHIYKNYDVMVDAKTYKPYQFLKLLRNTKDGASGESLVKGISRALETAFQRLIYEYDLTVTGGSRKGFIKSQKHLDDKAIKALKEAWEKYYQGNANTVILNDGMEFQEASNSSRENEMSQKDISFSNDIRNLFRTSGDYNTFIKNAIMPIADAFATALNRDFLLEKEKKSFYFAPDTKELLKGSMKERYEAYQIAIKNGFKTRNEIRYLEDDDALEGLDLINLGLGDVLLNPNTGEVYTPNTNKMVKMGGNESEFEEKTPTNDETTPNSSENEPNSSDLEEKEGITPLNQENAVESEERGC